MAKWQRVGGAVLALTVAMSPAGYRALKSHEGLGQPGAVVQKAYADPYYGWRIATICYGHTAGVKQGDTATLAQCDQFLREDVDKHCALVYAALFPLGVWLTQGEQDAYCSFSYNLGKFKDIIEEYSDANELYETYLTEKWQKISFCNDRESYGRFVKLIVGGPR